MTCTGAEGGAERSSYYSRGLAYDDWYSDDDDEVAAGKAAASVLPVSPAAAGDCSPRPNYRRPPTPFDPKTELYEEEDYQRQKVRGTANDCL